MLSVYGCATKKVLKTRVGSQANGLFVETSVFGPEFKGDGTYAVVGPSPYRRKWYAQVTVKGGLVSKVS